MKKAIQKAELRLEIPSDLLESVREKFGDKLNYFTVYFYTIGIQLEDYIEIGWLLSELRTAMKKNIDRNMQLIK